MKKSKMTQEEDLWSSDGLSESNPLSTDQLEAIMKDPFKIGTFFLKYRQIRDPAMRFIWISLKDDALCWSKPADMHLRSKVKGSLPISEIVRIKDGLQRTRGLPKDSRESRLSCSFSIITNATVIELEAPTEKVKADWMNHLCTLVAI